MSAVDAMKQAMAESLQRIAERELETMAKVNPNDAATLQEIGGPGRITQVFNVGPSPGVLTESGALFILGREGNDPDGAVKWDCIRAPNKSDLENEFK